MPCSRDWLLNPLGVVQELFAHNGPNLEWEKKVTEYFREKLKENNASKWVPSLNEVPLHYLKPNSLVRFRCMVQDMFDPELYMGVYETVDASSKSRVLHFGKYRDMAECGPRQEVDVNSAQTVTLERQTFYCVPVPGESPWVKEAYASSNQTHVCPSTSYAPSRHKRSYDDMECQPSRHKESCSGDGDFHGCGEPKRLETEAPAGQWLMSPNCSPSLDLNFPLPGEKGPACLVKVYENRDNLKVNDVLEVFGVLSVDSVPCATEERENTSPFLDAMDCADSIEEQRVHSPPASLVPRIHVLLIHKLQQINPLIPSSLQEEEKKLFVSGFMLELSSVRAELLGFLTHAFLGDSLAAEYLILHLISTVYARRDVLPLGKFSLNLSGCPRSSHFPHHLYRILQQLVPSSYNLQMTIQNMNTLRFVPRKDYTSNRLLSGLLQLASNTLLQIDETVLEEGQLDTTGVQNVTALGNLITWQKVDYDFRYHQMEFPCNINVLVTSEGRSLLPSDCQVHLKPEILPPNMEEYVSNLLTAVVPSLLNKFRIYLSLVRLLDYSISDEVTKAVEEDFVEMRKNDPQSITADDLHRILVVARLLSLSAGQTTLSRERWLRAKQLESQRKTRLQQQQCVNGNEL
ncbi:mini-chromosome maintenance complex-binding protein isoform X2 [Microcaecilia unicolor]|uniref:Mini-chromosome maintenance complex-binding protein n=1 Tax=Microcaecilia unicolor TaxID=1415580 RepID=A0A6P7Y032_9AMPH|nr:mini-chromosome maintenance complex-binding protein isoform X2 [Microcaecilia unicolor]